jgi:ribosome recycling factor
LEKRSRDLFSGRKRLSPEEVRMDSVIKQTEDKMKKSLSALEEEFNTLRTGRASPALFDRIRVEYYGNPTPLNQVATISVPEARLVVIQPWDKSVIGEIEKAIQKSELSVNPSNDGKVIRINIPPLTEERRKEYVKVAKNMAEQSRVSIRNVRRDANDELKKSQKDGDISEDDLKRAEDEVQKLTDKYVEEVNTMLEAKESEILEI